MNANMKIKHGPAVAREAEVRQMLVETMHAAAERLGPRTVVLFGSRATGSAKDRSDFDLGVIGEEPMPFEDFYAIDDLIETLPTLYRIDWVDLTRASPKFRAAALEHADVLYET